MAVEVYFNFEGNCREAIGFYANAFGVESPRMMTFGEAPPNPEYPLPEELKDLIMHARMNVGGSRLMFSDTFPGHPYSVGSNITLAYQGKTEDEVRTVFNKLSDGGTIVMDLQETFWSKLYGQVTDKFGTIWQVNVDSGEAW